MKRIRSVFAETDTGPQFNTKNRLARAFFNRGLLLRLARTTSVYRRSPADLIRSLYPFILPEATKPARVSVEFTNYCNVRCTYCSALTDTRERGLMSETTFSRLVEQLSAMGVGKVEIVGNGEPTIHPQFSTFTRELAKVCKFLSLTTNGQRLDTERIRTILEAPVDAIKVSVDGKDKEGYEKSRVGGNFERLLSNLTELKRMKGEYGSPILIILRVMLRPSQRSAEGAFLDFWRPFGDVVVRQHIVDFTGADGDTFQRRVEADIYPRCALPSKQLDIRWNGDVPLCSYSQHQTGDSKGLLLGNINDRPIQAFRNESPLADYRAGHRRREKRLMPLCRGCRYGS